MKRFITNFSAILSIMLLMVAPVSAFIAAAPYWQVNISQPATQNARTFNVQYTVLSTGTDSFTVKLYQDGIVAPLQTEVTSTDLNAFNGNSGTFAVSVLTDGDYIYHLAASRDSSTDPIQTTSPITVHVDATAPAAPAYNGKTQSGNTYSLSFTAPADTDVKNVQIFASTSTTYTADASTRIGDIVVTPGQSQSFSYNAPDGAVRYFALEAFDTAGNGSILVGDPGIVVHPVRVVAASNQSTSGATLGGSATTDETVTSQQLGAGQINAAGESATAAARNTKVLGTATTKMNLFSNTKLGLSSILVLILLGLAYYEFNKRQTKK